MKEPGEKTGKAEKVHEIHVTPEGRKDGKGTPGNPFGCLHAAVEECRRQRGKRKIVLGGGKYRLEAPLELDGRDSGLLVEGASGQAPVISGGRVLHGWKPEPGGLFWSAPAPGTDTGEWDFRQLYVNGQMRPQARLPHVGTWRHESRFDRIYDPCFDKRPSDEERATLKYGEGQLPENMSTADAEVVVLHVWDQSRARVASHVSGLRTLRLDPPCVYVPGTFGVREYYVLNIREGMTSPGQWYLDREKARVVYWPFPGEDPSACLVEAPFLPNLLSIGAKEGNRPVGVTVRDISFDITVDLPAAEEPAVWAGNLCGAVMISGARDCRLSKISVTHAGGQGVKVADSTGVRVEGSTVSQAGANGIALNSCRKSIVRGNRIFFTGEIHRQAVGMHLVSCVGNLVSGNEVSDCSYCGMTISRGGGNTLEGNHVWNVMKELNDGGCIYLCYSSDGNDIRGNRVHGSTGKKGALAIGIYLDIGTERVTCENNLVYDVGWALHVHMARNNTIRRNVFLCGKRGVSFYYSRNCLFENNLVVAENALIPFHDPGGAEFKGNTYLSAGPVPRFAEGLSFYGSQPFPNRYGQDSDAANYPPLPPPPGITGAPRPRDWRRAMPVQGFVGPHGDPVPEKHDIDVRFLAQGGTLHVRAVIGRQPPKAGAAENLLREGEIFMLFLKMRGENKGMAQFMASPDGSPHRLSWRGLNPVPLEWESSAEFLPGDRGWQVALAVPMKKLAGVLGGDIDRFAFFVGCAVANSTLDFAEWRKLGRDVEGNATGISGLKDLYPGKGKPSG